MKATLEIDAKLKYLYNFEDDEQTKTLVEAAQKKEVGQQWDEKYKITAPSVMQKFSKALYSNYSDTNTREIKPDGPWMLLYKLQGEAFKFFDGFYAELYFNTENSYLLLAIKEPFSYGNKITDLRSLSAEYKGGEINCAFTLGEKVRVLITKFKCKPILMITGHSLGGYLAQIVTYTIINYYVDKYGSVRYRNKLNDEFGIYTVVFDSPPASRLICSLDPHDPIEMERLNLPITNFVANINFVNSSPFTGPHLGQVLAIQDFECLEKRSCWKIIKDHVIKKFESFDPRNCCKVNNRSMRTLKYDTKSIPSNFFSAKNFERLKKYTFLTMVHPSFANLLPTFTISNSCIYLDDEKMSVEEFIPKANQFLSQFNDQLDRDVTGSIDIYKRWEADTIKDAHEFRLNEEWKQTLQNWKNGARIGGFESVTEMGFVGYLIHNSIPSCFYYDYDKLSPIDWERIMNFVTTTEATLILIVKNNNLQLNHKTNGKLKIIFLVLYGANDHKITLKRSMLEEKSQEQLQEKELDFFGNKVNALAIFGIQLLQELPVWSIINFQKEANFKNELHYSDQRIAGTDTKSKFKSATEFANELKKGKLNSVMISSDAGMGKSTTLKQIALTMQNNLQNYWIVHLNLSTIQNELYDAKDKLTSKVKAFELCRNAALAERRNDEVLKKVFNQKVKEKQMVLLFDSLDEICPLYRETADKLITLLRETKLQIVVATRPHEGKNFAKAEIFELQPLDSEELRKKFILQKCKLMGKSPPANTATWLEKVSGRYYEDKFWSVPLNLNMAVAIYGPAIELKAGSQQNKNIFEVFVKQSIKNTLETKLGMDETHNMKYQDYRSKYEMYIEFIEILAICTIFHAGFVTPEYHAKILKK
jgi:NACHT domain